MIRIIYFIAFLLLFQGIKAQLVDVRADYNSVGDCIFTANNNALTPVFLNIDFADLENTAFEEKLPYVKKLSPGFNSLFTLFRYPGADVPRFNYEIRVYRSDPLAQIDAGFPYLIPFREGSVIELEDVIDLRGFRGDTEPKSWNATGFAANAGEAVMAGRQGIVVEIAGNVKSGEPISWYNTWNNCITILHPDGTLACYKNIAVPEGTLQLNQKVFAGEKIGEIAPGEKQMLLVIYQNRMKSDDLRFIIPQFVVGEKEKEILLKGKTYTVVHPESVWELEMTKKEKRRRLKNMQ